LYLLRLSADHEQRRQASALGLARRPMYYDGGWANRSLALRYGQTVASNAALRVLYLLDTHLARPPAHRLYRSAPRYLAPLTFSSSHPGAGVGAVVAYLYTCTRFVCRWWGYFGGGRILPEHFSYVGSASDPLAALLALHQRSVALRAPFQSSPVAMLGYPLLVMCGACHSLQIGGLPPIAWRSLYRLFRTLLPDYVQQCTRALCRVGVLLLPRDAVFSRASRGLAYRPAAAPAVACQAALKRSLDGPLHLPPRRGGAGWC